MSVTYESIQESECSLHKNNISRPSMLDGTYTIVGITTVNINGYRAPFIECEGAVGFYADCEFCKKHIDEILEGKTLEVKSTKVMVTKGNKRYLQHRYILEVK